jgi:RNA polymerase sigma-70 factor (ECF subfamily)
MLTRRRLVGQADLAAARAFFIAELYGEHERELQRYAIRLCSDPDRANDLVAETFVRAITHRAQLEALNSYQRRAWLFRVLRNRFIDEQRALQREQTLLGQLAWSWQLRSPADQAQDLADFIPAHYRGLLYQRYTLDMTSEEIGQQLGVPAATVRSRLRLALKWLRSHRSKFT